MVEMVVVYDYAYNFHKYKRRVPFSIDFNFQVSRLGAR